jgi:hypothetical protein
VGGNEQRGHWIAFAFAEKSIVVWHVTYISQFSNSFIELLKFQGGIGYAQAHFCFGPIGSPKT